jgi:hypothetical protein
MEQGGCYDPSLGPMTKARGMERWGQWLQPKDHIHTPGSVQECEGMNPHTPKWAPNVPKDS